MSEITSGNILSSNDIVWNEKTNMLLMIKPLNDDQKQIVKKTEAFYVYSEETTDCKVYEFKYLFVSTMSIKDFFDDKESYEETSAGGFPSLFMLFKSE